MSFGSSFSDVYLLGQLTWKIVKNAREACGEHAGITVEVSALCAVIGRLEEEIGKPESALFGDSFGEIWIQELQNLVEACRKVMHVLDIILNKYNALNEQERSGRRLWQKIKFGNGEMRSLNELRNKIILYTSSINLYLNMATTGTTGRIEQKMNDHGGVLRDIQLSVNGIAAQLVTKNGHGGSVLTDYTNDDKSVWRDFRRELRNEGFSSSVIHKHKRTILDYVKELGGRGLLDEHISTSTLKKFSGDSELIEVGRTYLSPPSTKLPGLPEPIELQCQLRKDPCSTLLAHSKSKTCGVEVFSSSNTSHQAGNEMNSGSQNHETLSTDLPPLACSTDHVRASFEAETSKCPEKSDMRHEENISANLKREIGLEDKDDTEAKAILGLENGRGAKDDEIDKGDIGEHEKASNQDAFDEDTTDEDIAEGYSTEEDTEHEGDEAELVKDSDDKYGTEPGKNEDQVHSQNVKALSPAQVSNTGLATKDRTRRVDREEEHLQATEADSTRVEVILGLSELPKKGILQAPTIRFFEPEVRETYGYRYQEGKLTFNECDKFPSEHYCRVHATPPLKRSGAKAVKNHCIAKGALSETSHHYRDRYVGRKSEPKARPKSETKPKRMGQYYVSDYQGWPSASPISSGGVVQTGSWFIPKPQYMQSLPYHLQPASELSPKRPKVESFSSLKRREFGNCLASITSGFRNEWKPRFKYYMDHLGETETTIEAPEQRNLREDLKRLSEDLNDLDWDVDEAGGDDSLENRSSMLWDEMGRYVLSIAKVE